MVRKQGGFTLMELLIAVAVLLILSVVGLDSFIFSIKKSHDAARKSDLATMQRGLEAFITDWGSYPSDDGAGKMIACDYNNSGSLSTCDWGRQMAAFFPPSAIPANRALVSYLAKIPTDPVTTQNYYYQKTATGYNIFAAIENTSDPYYKAGLSQTCGGGVTCNYQVSQAGVQ